MEVHFFNQEIRYKYPYTKVFTPKFSQLIEDKSFLGGVINFIFCSEEELLKINKKYLVHNTHTDIITFDYSENKKLSADIFLSIVRIKENAFKFNCLFIDELHRCMVHGVLHLLGYKDKTVAQKKQMRKEETKLIKAYFSF